MLRVRADGITFGEMFPQQRFSFAAAFNREIREFKTRVYGKRQTAEVTTRPWFLLIYRLPFAVTKWR